MRIKREIKALNEQKERLQNEIIDLNNDVHLQDFILYKPSYSFATSQEYAEKLESCRNKQKEMILSKTACTCKTIWHLSGDFEAAKNMVNECMKMCIASFNAQCELIIDKTTFNNYDSAKKKIQKVFEQITSYADGLFKISFSTAYLELKLQELSLAYEFKQKKRQEKEYAREQREIERERIRAQKEMEEERQRLEKEQIHYTNRLLRLQEQLRVAENKYLIDDINERIAATNIELQDIEKALQDIDYRQANERAGYVYIISNIGAFGDGVYKIGMTRRLEPMDRIDELSNASVPFRFDVHAMIFSDDAPALETFLHNRFANYRVNLVNNRKEFYRVPLNDIEAAIKENFDKTCEFQYYSVAQQYRESLLIREEQ